MKEGRTDYIIRLITPQRDVPLSQKNILSYKIMPGVSNRGKEVQLACTMFVQTKFYTWKYLKG